MTISTKWFTHLEKDYDKAYSFMIKKGFLEILMAPDEKSLTLDQMKKWIKNDATI
jgi:hypothetical protein